MTVNWTVDIGQIVQILLIVGAVIGAHYSLKANLREFGVRLDHVEKNLALTIEAFRRDMSATGERLRDHEDRMFDLSGQLQRIIGGLDRRTS